MINEGPYAKSTIMLMKKRRGELIPLFSTVQQAKSFLDTVLDHSSDEETDPFGQTLTFKYTKKGQISSWKRHYIPYPCKQIPALANCPDWVKHFTEDLDEKEAEAVDFIEDNIPNPHDHDEWDAFYRKYGLRNVPTEQMDELKEFCSFLETASADTFIKVVFYDYDFRQRLIGFTAEVNDPLFRRLLTPNFEDRIILKYFYPGVQIN